MYKPLRQQQGFTLIEMMIVVAIIAILAFIAVPAYRNQMISTNRADAQGALMSFAQAMERHYTETGSYEGAASGKNGNPKNKGKPSIFATQAPLDGPTKHYNLRVSAATATTYTLTADPTPKKDNPISGMQKNDGRLTLRSDGQRLWYKKVGGSVTW